MIKFKMVAAAVAMSAFSAVAFGAGEKAGSQGTFKTHDADGNGAISMDEARSVPGLSEKFSKADKNGDGQLSKSEYESAVKGGKSESKSKQQ